MPRKYIKVACPEELEKIIEVINILPENIERVVAEIPEIILSTYDENDNIIEDNLSEDYKKLDKKVLEFLHKEPENEYHERFQYLLKARILLRHFAEISKQYLLLPKEQKNDKNVLYRILLHFLSVDYRKRQFVVLLGLQFPTLFIKPVDNDFLNIFREFDIPLYRIRSCPICNDIYWAKKLNSETCGKKFCVNTLGNKKRSKN